ncbi:MAG: T9SS type A sorting domain-containing protein [Saprospiraceae bacterium]|nr:T9SS type A sorting domain-containing protein [Saprospiraceae bacterium]
MKSLFLKFNSAHTQFLRVLFLALFINFNIGNSQDSNECGFPDPPEELAIGSGVYCGNNPNPSIDYGNYFYIPEENDPLLYVRVNVHIMQFSEDEPGNFTNSTTDIALLQNLINNEANDEVLGRSGIAEQCEGIDTNAPLMVDSKIRFVLNNIYFHVDPVGYSNDGSYYNKYCYNNYVANNPDISKDMNIFFCVIDNTTVGGYGPGYYGESSNYIMMINKFQVLQSGGSGNNTWDLARSVVHEFGHCMGLLHSCLSSQQQLFNYECLPPCGWAPTSSNHNMSYNNTRTYMSPLQFAHMRRLLLTSWREKLLVTPIQSYKDFNLTTDYSIDENKQVHYLGNIIVKQGATLTVKGILKMYKDKKIIVERGANLIVDGGLITSCDDPWQGIVVEGDASSNSQVNAGKVELMNGAVIENANVGVSMYPTHIAWPNTPAYYGGLVTANNATFRNGNKAVEFMKYGVGYTPDQSSFIDCTFENMSKSAITIWADNGIEFDNCSFTNIAENGIGAYDSEVLVHNGCEFISNDIGVNLYNTFPNLVSSSIGFESDDSNEFACTTNGVYALATAGIETLELQNNTIYGGSEGVKFSGISLFDVRNNDIVGSDIGVDLLSTGEWNSDVRSNQISSSRIGSEATYTNKFVEYLNNCFQYSSSTDILVNAGEIHVKQGDESKAASNCFSQGGIPEIDNTGNPLIYYFVKDDEPLSSCEYPSNSLNIEIKNNSTGKYSDGCGTGNVQNVINSTSICGGPYKNKAELLQAIQDLEADISNVENNGIISPAYKTYLLALYKRCLKKLKAQVIIIIVEPRPGTDENSRKEEAISYLLSQSDYHYHVFAYGMMVRYGEYQRARQLLNTFNRSIEALDDFVTVQLINLDFLAATGTYTLSATDRSLLYSLGMKTEPLNGYARAVYELLTGEHIELDIPSSRNNGQNRFATTQDRDGIEYNSYPNPVSHGVYHFYTNTDDIYHIDIRSITGLKVYSQDNCNVKSVNIDTQDWANGVYIFTVKDKDRKPLYQTKIVVLQ